MEFKQLLSKMLLVAAGLLVGTNAWADKVYTTIYSNDYETASSISDIKSGDYKDCQITDGSNHYLKIRENGRNGGSASLTFPTYSTYDEYVLSFKVGFYTSNKKSSSFQLRNGTTTLATFGWGTWNDAGATISYTIGSTAQTETLTATKQSSSTRASDTNNSIVKWYTFTLAGDNTNNKVTLTVNDGTTDIISNSIISNSYVCITSLYCTLGNAHAEIGFDDMLLKAYSDTEVMSTPSIEITGVDGSNRVITITGGTSSKSNAVTTYYTIDDSDPTSTSSVYSAPITVTSDCTVKAISISSSSTASSISSLEVKTGPITLNTPTWSRTNYSAGVSTITLASNQSSVLLSPTADVYYKINDGVATKYTAAFSVNDGETLSYYATATGYTNSAELSITAVAPNSNPTLWTESYVASADKQTITRDGDAVTTIGETDYFYMTAATDGRISERLLTSTANGSSNWLYRTGGVYGGIAQNYAVIGLESGDYVTINFSKGDGNPNGNNTDAILDEWNSTSSSYSYNVTGTTGVFRFSIARYGYIKSISVQRAPVTVDIKTTGTTFSSAYAIDCAKLPDGVKAYKVASINKTEKKAVLAEVTEAVKAETGLILIAETAGTFNIPVAATGTDISSTNLLQAAVTATPVTADQAYGLSEGKFKKLNAGSVPAGKAYLLASDITNAPELDLDFGGVTAITNMSRINDTTIREVYNLNGQRVAQPTRGLYIVNGKKVVIK